MTTRPDENPGKNALRAIVKRFRRGFIIWLIFAIVSLLYFEAPYEIWAHHTLLKDAREGTAFVSGELSHNRVKYRYTVNQREYIGADHRNQDQEKYRAVKAGQDTIVFYSASHPEISRLQMPHGWGEFIFSYLLFPFIFGVVILIACLQRTAR